MKLELNIVGGATWVLNVENKFKIACDPVLAPIGTEYNFTSFKSKRIKAPIYDDSTFENVKIWLLTHKHADHIDKLGIKRILKEDYVVCDKNSHDLLKTAKNENIIILDWHKSQIIKIQDYTVEIEAIPAFHGKNYITRVLAGKVNGYLITINDGKVKKTIYVTSDTVFDKKIIKSLKNHRIDVLIANMGEVRSKKWGGPLTMDISMLNMFIKEINPQKIIPVHIDDFSHYETRVETLKKNGIEIIENGSFVTL
ncbi:MAG TPA: MBL fold metallo-hydrolase [Methanobacteriaceae archaeon]|nr:MBL fold metallo-hydrolase [Methanobacteriaceae archaeon]